MALEAGRRGRIMWLDMVGKKYGEWTVLRYSHADDEEQATYRHWFECQCSCGYTGPVRGVLLRYGKSMSCRPCASKKSTIERKKRWVEDDAKYQLELETKLRERMAEEQSLYLKRHDDMLAQSDIDSKVVRFHFQGDPKALEITANPDLYEKLINVAKGDSWSTTVCWLKKQRCFINWDKVNYVEFEQ